MKETSSTATHHLNDKSCALVPKASAKHDGSVPGHILGLEGGLVECCVSPLLPHN